MSSEESCSQLFSGENKDESVGQSDEVNVPGPSNGHNVMNDVPKSKKDKTTGSSPESDDGQRARKRERREDGETNSAECVVPDIGRASGDDNSRIADLCKGESSTGRPKKEGSTAERAEVGESSTERPKEGESSTERPKEGENNHEKEERNCEPPPFSRLRVRSRHRRYRRRLSNSSSSSSSNEEEPQEVASSSSSPQHPDDSDSTDDSMIGNRIIDALNRQVAARALALDSDDTWSLLDSDDSDSSNSERDRELAKEELDEASKKYQKCFTKEVPKHKWCVTKAIMNRQFGMHTHLQEPELFYQRCYSSLHCVKRLELMYKLKEHNGCVNAVSFNQSGTRLASGSDDKKIIVWDWAIGKSLVTFNSGHTSNVFQAKFLPMSGDNYIVSSARDGQVRLAVLSSTGEMSFTKRLAHHRKPVNKLSILPDTPNVFLSAGEDGRVMSIDVRSNEQTTLVTVKDDRRKIGLYSVDSHPLNSQEFCVCGVDYYIRLYDKRKIDVNGAPMKKFCPHHIVGTNKYTNITCALYNHDGTEIIGSYNDESLYLFDTRHSDGADFVHKYEGHRNSATVKGCDFFGPKSEYIISGSDCGNIFFWDKNTEAIVQFMRGDQKGVVNALAGHPQFPFLATSGLDSDVKIWVPSCEQDPEMKELRRVVTKNLRDRENDQPYRVDVFESHLNMELDREFGVNIRNFSSRRGTFPLRLRVRFTDDGQLGSTSSDSSDSDGYGGAHPIQCPQS